MSIVGLFFVIAILVVVAWLVNSLIPMDARIKQAVNIIIGLFIAFVIIVFLLQILGISTGTHFRLN